MEEKNTEGKAGVHRENEAQEGLSCSKNTDKLFTALAKAQTDFGDIKKDSTADVGSYSYSYATLPAVIEATRKALADNQLFVTQPIVPMMGGWAVETKIAHSSGQFQRSWIPINTKLTPQQLGSAITYYRRYQLAAILGIAADEDDDGQAAQSAYKQPQKNSHPPRQTGQTFAGPPAQRQNGQRQPYAPKNSKWQISESQRKRLYAISQANRWEEEHVKDFMLQEFNCDSSKKLTRVQYDLLCKKIMETGQRAAEENFPPESS